MPEIGRWGSVDPLSEIRPWESSYIYVGNNPPKRIDPFGLEWVDTDGDGTADLWVVEQDIVVEAERVPSLDFVVVDYGEDFIEYRTRDDDHHLSGAFLAQFVLDATIANQLPPADAIVHLNEGQFGSVPELGAYFIELLKKSGVAITPKVSALAYAQAVSILNDPKYNRVGPNMPLYIKSGTRTDTIYYDPYVEGTIMEVIHKGRRDSLGHQIPETMDIFKF